MRKLVLARRLLAVVAGAPLAALFGFVFACSGQTVTLAGDHHLSAAEGLDLTGPEIAAGLFVFYTCIFPQSYDSSCAARFQLIIVLRALVCGSLSGMLGLWMYFFPAR